MAGVQKNYVEAAKQNECFRQTIVTGEHSQVVLMTLQVGEDIGDAGLLPVAQAQAHRDAA